MNYLEAKKQHDWSSLGFRSRLCRVWASDSQSSNTLPSSVTWWIEESLVPVFLMSGESHGHSFPGMLLASG